MQVASAAPVAAGLASGGDGEVSLSALYGGSGDEQGAAVPVYNAIGRVRRLPSLLFSGHV